MVGRRGRRCGRPAVPGRPRSVRWRAPWPRWAVRWPRRRTRMRRQTSTRRAASAAAVRYRRTVVTFKQLQDAQPGPYEAAAATWRTAAKMIRERTDDLLLAKNRLSGCWG